jgi:hypothetical protein
MFPSGIRIWSLAGPVLLALGLMTEQRLAAVPMEGAEGLIVTLDRYAVVLEDPAGEVQRVFSVNQSTKIMRNGNLARRTDLRPGDEARITFRPLGDKLIALTITAAGP